MQRRSWKSAYNLARKNSHASSSTSRAGWQEGGCCSRASVRGEGGSRAGAVVVAAVGIGDIVSAVVLSGVEFCSKEKGVGDEDRVTRMVKLGSGGRKMSSLMECGLDDCGCLAM